MLTFYCNTKKQRFEEKGIHIVSSRKDYLRGQDNINMNTTLNASGFCQPLPLALNITKP